MSAQKRTIGRKQQGRDARTFVHEPGDVELLHELADNRPQTRADCEAGERPCPYLSCRYHLYLDVNAAGGIQLNFPDKELHELEETCALDVAERHGATLEHVGSLMNVTRERIRQLETKALRATERKVG
jgi:hypothetical protein